METIRFLCSHCNTGLKVSEKAAGKFVRCVKCHKLVKVPEPTLVEMPVHGNGQVGFSEPTTDVIEELSVGWPIRKDLANIAPKTAPTKSAALPLFTLAPPKPTWLARSRPLAEAIGHSLGILWQKVRARPWVAIAILGGALSTILISVVLLGVFYVLSTGGRPSETAIKQAITDCVERDGNFKVSDVKIKDVGRFGRYQGIIVDYWPIRATYTGSFIDTVMQPRDFTDVFAVYKTNPDNKWRDEPGKWIATREGTY